MSVFSLDHSNESHFAKRLRFPTQLRPRLLPGLACSFVIAMFMTHGGASAQSNDPTRGLAFIGLNRASDPDVDVVIDEFKRAGGQLNLGLLPFEFSKTGENPFRKIDRLIKGVASASSVKVFNVTFYMRWYEHNEGGRKTADQLYKAFENGRTGNERVLFENRVNETMRYVKAFRNEMTSGNNKVNFTVVPVLEDECTNRAGYRAINDFIRAAAEWAGVSVSLRRSHVLLDDGKVTRFPFDPPLAVPTEVHGISIGWVEQKLGRKLVKGEWYSNDGASLEIGKFISDVKSFKTRGIHVAYWQQEFNGERKDRNGNDIPQSKRIVQPYSDPVRGAANRAALKRFLAECK